MALPRSCASCGEAIGDDFELCVHCRSERIPSAMTAEGDILLDELPADLLDEDLPSPVRGAARFIGRTALLDRLVERSIATTEEPARFVAVLGAAGAGKTRLAHELSRRLAQAHPGVRVLSAVTGGPPYGVFRHLFAQRFAIEPTDNEDVSRGRISKVVESVVGKARALEVAHLIAHLIGLPFPDSAVLAPLADSPSQLEARTFIAVRRFLDADARRNRVVILVDDVDRASAETVNLLHYLAAGLDGDPLLLVCFGKPELFDLHPTFGKGDVTLERIELGPLTSDEAQELLAELTQTAPPASVIEHVRAMSSSPRALESLVLYLRESDVLVGEGTSAHFDDAHLGSFVLPKDLASLTAARFRRMTDAERDLLEKAAACGESFWLDAVVALVRAVVLDSGDPDGPSLGEVAAAGDRTRGEVADALSLLVDRELLVETTQTRGPNGEREFRFAAPPWWDTVYAGIDAAQRRRYHRIVAQWLELRPLGRNEEEQEDIARHLERAGDGEAAALRYRRAGDAARARYFNEKAIRLYVAALACLGQHDLASRIHLWHDLGSVFQLKGDFDSALGAFERMLRLSWVVASRTKAAVAFNKMGRIYRQKSDLTIALEYLERGLELFELSGDTRGVAGSLDDIGQVLWLSSRYEEALDRSAAALEMRRRFGDPRSIAASLINIGNIERHRGLFEEARACYEEATELRSTLGDVAGVIEAHNGLGMIAYHRGDLNAAQKYWSNALARAEQIGSTPLEALLLNHLGEVARAFGQRSEARMRFQAAHALATELADKRLLCEALYNLGLLELADGRAEEAQKACNDALELAEAAGIRVDVGRALLALGEVHASTLFDDTGAGRRGVADEYFQRGVGLFREIGNEAELAHGLLRYGHYRVERGSVDAGRELLHEAELIFARLGMHADTRARAVIGELSAS